MFISLVILSVSLSCESPTLGTVRYADATQNNLFDTTDALQSEYEINAVDTGSDTLDASDPPTTCTSQLDCSDKKAATVDWCDDTGHCVYVPFDGSMTDLFIDSTPGHWLVYVYHCDGDLRLGSGETPYGTTLAKQQACACGISLVFYANENSEAPSSACGVGVGNISVFVDWVLVAGIVYVDKCVFSLAISPEEMGCAPL